MPTPTGVTMTINTGDEATNDLDVTLSIAATGADEMRFSNNGGFSWSPFEAYATSKAWNMSDYDGLASEGIKTVLMEVRDLFDDERAQVTDFILFEVPVPRIVFDALTPPFQRSDTNIVEIPYAGFEDSLAAADAVALLGAEIDTSGLFTGGELDLLELPGDSLNDGRVGLLFSNAGESLVFVADLLGTFGMEIASAATRVRLKPQFGSKTGDWAVSPAFTIQIQDPPVTEELGRKTIPGRAITLVAYFRNALNELEDPTVGPTLEEVLDSTDTDQLGGSVPMVSTVAGVWTYSFTPAVTDPVGQWRYRVSYEMGGPVGAEELLGFFIVETPTVASFPLQNDTCVLYGDLFLGDGMPFENALVQVAPHHLSDPELGNTTSVSTSRREVLTDANGHFEIEMIRNTEVVVRIPDLGYKQFGKIPDDDAAEYKTITTLLPTGTRDKFGNRVP